MRGEAAILFFLSQIALVGVVARRDDDSCSSIIGFVGLKTGDRI